MAMTIMAMTVAGGDGAYTDDVGGKLRCRIIIMPALLHWQACRVNWQTLGKPEARIANVLASIACGIQKCTHFVTFRLASNGPNYKLL